MKQQKQYPCYYKLHLSFNCWDQEMIIECPHRYRSTNVFGGGVADGKQNEENDPVVTAV